LPGKKVKLHSDKAPAAIGPYSQAIQAGDFVFVSGQLPIDAKTGGIVGNTIEEQTRQSLKNIQHILEDHQLSMENVVKTTVFLKNIQDFPAMNKVYAEFFTDPFPARAAIEAAHLPLGALVEIEVIAVK
jgi:endoribonuclease L-PSP